MGKDSAVAADERAEKAGADVVPRPLPVEPDKHESYQITFELEEELPKKTRESAKRLVPAQ